MVSKCNVLLKGKHKQMFGDLEIGDFFIQNDCLYKKIVSVTTIEKDIEYNGILVDSGILMYFHNAESVERVDVEITVTQWRNLCEK